MNSKSKNAAVRSKMDDSLKEERRRGTGEFDGLLGSFPEGTSIVLSDIIGYLRRYLLDERGFSEAEILKLLNEHLTPLHEKAMGFSSYKPLDEGMYVAVGILNSIRSALRVTGKQLTPRNKHGRPIYDRKLTDDEHVRLLISGPDGLRGARVRAGGGRRGLDIKTERQLRVTEMQRKINEAAAKFPQMDYRNLARRVAAELKCSERTVRRNTRNPRTMRLRDTTS